MILGLYSALGVPGGNVGEDRRSGVVRFGVRVEDLGLGERPVSELDPKPTLGEFTAPVDKFRRPRLGRRLDLA